jgi:hypothetical protein
LLQAGKASFASSTFHWTPSSASLPQRLSVWCSSDLFFYLRKNNWRFFFCLQEIVVGNAFVMMFMAAQRKDVKF